MESTKIYEISRKQLYQIKKNLSNNEKFVTITLSKFDNQTKDEMKRFLISSFHEKILNIDSALELFEYDNESIKLLEDYKNNIGEIRKNIVSGQSATIYFDKLDDDFRSIFIQSLLQLVTKRIRDVEAVVLNHN